MHPDKYIYVCVYIIYIYIYVYITFLLLFQRKNKNILNELAHEDIYIFYPSFAFDI